MKRSLPMLSACLLTAVSAMLFFGVNGEAYIDPSGMTYMIQAIAGLVSAVGAIAGIYYRRAKKKISKTLNIDENRGKEVESDEIVIRDEQQDEGTHS